MHFFFNFQVKKEEANILGSDIICVSKEKFIENQPKQLIYNPVPKCGSKGLREMIKVLQKKNEFRATERNYDGQRVTVPYHLR